MNMSQLKALVKKGESEVLEFKKSTAQLSAAMQTVCAFLNSDVGGTVLIGVTDDGKIIGQAIADGTKKEIAGEISKLEPHAKVDIDYVSVKPDLAVIVLMVGSGNNAPYVYEGRSFLRSQSTTRRMPQGSYEQLLYDRRSSSISWESLTTNDCVIKDLDKGRIQQVIDMAVAEKRLPSSALRASTEEMLKKFKLLVGNRLTNAAVILFCKDEFKQFMQSNIRLARFKGITKSEFLDEKSIQGNVFELYEQAMTFLSNYLPIGARIEEGNPLRVTTPAIPYKVLREALVNALCHKDYSLQGGSLWVAVYDDRVEIVSSGGLLSSIKLSNLTKQHESHLRNNLIAGVLYSCHMIERWGRGTLDMIELCKQSGNPLPKFEATTGSFSVILPLRDLIPRVMFERAVQSPVSTRLTSRQKEIIKILKNGSMSSELIVAKMNQPPTLRTVQMELAKLQALGLIDTVGKGRGRAVLWKLNAK